MRIGSMFSGVGGLDFALRALWPDSEIAWFCEWDKHASRVLDVRFPGVPNHHDVSATDWSTVEPVDVVCGGFPCQDISHAGKRAGIKEGTRSGLWFDMLDAVRVLRPRLLLLENVAAITSADGGLDVVLGSLAEAGWDAEWTLLRASDVGAPHRRDRWFCVAYPRGERHGPREDRGGVGRLDGLHAGEARQRQRAREVVGDRSPTAPADPGRDGLLRGTEQDLGPHGPGQQAPLGDVPDGLALGDHGTDWGEYAGAIRRWELILGRPAPVPTDPKGRLNPDFVEWMMGWPVGWTDVEGSSRVHRLKQCGNGVVPHQAYAAYSHLLALVDSARRQQAA